jgi:hypothetical protein
VIEISLSDASAAFQRAVHELSQTELRSELVITQIPSPKGLAKEAVAFTADVSSEHISDTADAGTGRFVLLHEPKPQEQWGGVFRIITFSKSPLETLIGADEMISEVSWAWLLEALENRSAEYSHEAGTTTRIISSGFGSLAGQSDHAELEMRASWSPAGDIAKHFAAWQDLICMMSGYPLFPSEPTRLNRVK